jgi:hypothetical protein
MPVINTSGKIVFTAQIPVQQVWFQVNCGDNRQLATMYFAKENYNCSYSKEHEQLIKEYSKNLYK